MLKFPSRSIFLTFLLLSDNKAIKASDIIEHQSGECVTYFYRFFLFCFLFLSDNKSLLSEMQNKVRATEATLVKKKNGARNLAWSKALHTLAAPTVQAAVRT